ncbi:MAG TPA: hypothetical protein VKE69_13835, partial [Planctomycetota bacterium]|nr:hypothetical protein [Planctomycetota bacterium]
MNRTPAVEARVATAVPRWQTLPVVPFALTGVFLAFALLPRVHGNPKLLVTFEGVAAALVGWTAILWLGAKRWPKAFRVECAPLLRSHYIQASVQLCIYAYWGWYWRDVYAQVPLILSELVFLYTFDALLSWTRGRPWRLGCGPLPIILSTNVFLWFKDDVFVFQFLLVAVGALGKEFVKWERNGRRTHVFNPSAFTLALFSIVLLATGTTATATMAEKIARTTADPPLIYLLIFALGIVVQSFFSVTLMTLSAAIAIGTLSLAYFGSTGTYYFVTSFIPA